MPRFDAASERRNLVFHLDKFKGNFMRKFHLFILRFGRKDNLYPYPNPVDNMLKIEFVNSQVIFGKLLRQPHRNFGKK